MLAHILDKDIDFKLIKGGRYLEKVSFSSTSGVESR